MMQQWDEDDVATIVNMAAVSHLPLLVAPSLKMWAHALA